MRCPKCGFHSFDYLDSCKKCGGDLTELKLRFRFQGYVAPPGPATIPPPEEPSPHLPEVAEAEGEAIDFGFDVLDEADGRPPATFADTAGISLDRFAEPGSDDPTAIDMAADSGLSFGQPFSADDNPDFDQPFPSSTDFDFGQPLSTAGDLSLDQPFSAESENLPDDDLPKFDDRF